METAKILCDRCGKPVTHFDQWFTEDCTDGPGGDGHTLTRKEVRELEFRKEVGK